ncbi:MAG TPA: hypothetical protein VGR30_05015 [Candidatus Binatia bacterium]|jgi:hypothetical protein|nr:hypothetical protein [Candidatus Binatia bacterium]
MKPARLTLVGVTGLILLCATVLAGAQTRNKQAKTSYGSSPRLGSSEKTLLEKRKELIERKKASRDGLGNLLQVYEKKLERQSADYETKKELYQSDLISKAELEESRRAMTHTRLEIQQVQQWIAEDDVALLLSELAAQGKLERLPLGGYHETATFIRYNGAADWSLANTGKIKEFFLKRFGRPLPVSAMGQSSTHDDMGFDHRDAIDVAVRPDSEEGRGLMAYLRKAGIPFIAFRNKVRGMATGAHIHIGRPSLRIAQVKQGLTHPALLQKAGDES